MKKLKLKCLGDLPVGCLDVARLHFWGHSVWRLADYGGIKFARIHGDWGLTIVRYDNTRVKIPSLVLCSRDRLHSREYIKDAVNGEPVDKASLVIDNIDREFSRILKGWNEKKT